MSFDYVRRTYGVPAKRGGRVEIRDAQGDWAAGTLTRADHHVIVRPDDRPRARLRYHPQDTDNLRYRQAECAP